MATYCEVCQGLYDVPHPHLLGQRSPLLYTPTTGNPMYPSASQPNPRKGTGSRATRDMSWPRVASHSHSAPRESRFFPGGRLRGHRCVSPYVCPCQQRRSASMPAVSEVGGDFGSRGVSSTAHNIGQQMPSGITGDWERSEGKDTRLFRGSLSPVALSAAVVPNRKISAGVQRYRESTYSSQRRAGGSPLHSDFLLRGTERRCSYAPLRDGHGDGEERGVVIDSGDAVFLSSSRSPRTLGDPRRTSTQGHRRISTDRSPNVRGVRLPTPREDLMRNVKDTRRISPALSSSSSSSSSPLYQADGPSNASSSSFDHAPNYVSEYVIKPRSRYSVSGDHGTQRASPTLDRDRRPHILIPATDNIPDAGESSPSSRPPLLPPVVRGPSLDATRRSQTSSSAEAPLQYSRHGDSAQQQALSHRASRSSRARDSLADLVSKIRAEVSKDASLWATGVPVSDVVHHAPDVSRRATAGGKTKRQSRSEKPRRKCFPSGSTSHAEHRMVTPTTTSTPLSLSTVSSAADGAADTDFLIHPQSTTTGKDGAHAYRSSSVPPAVGRRARSAQSTRRRRSPGEQSGPSGHELPSSSSSSENRSSSSAHLRSAVRKAETVLRHLRRRHHSNDGACKRSPFAGSTMGSMPNWAAEDAAGVLAASVGSRHQTPAGDFIYRKRRSRSHDPNARRRHSAPPLHIRPHVTRASPRHSSSASISTEVSEESRDAAQGAHAHDRANARGVRKQRGGVSTTNQVQDALASDSIQQEEGWRTAQERRIERLRKGLAALCAVVRRDLHRVRDDVDKARAEADSQAEYIRKQMCDVLASTLHPGSPHGGSSNTGGQRVDIDPTSLLTTVSQCSQEDQRQIALLLLPHLRPLLEGVIHERVQRLLYEHRREEQEAQHALEERVHAYVAGMAVSHQRSVRENETTASESHFVAPAWAAFSSAEAFAAYLRSTTRAVLLEEDDRRYALANENERRHERRVQQLQQRWEERLSTAQAQWRAELRDILREEANSWTRRARAPLQQHADVLQEIVKALTRDVTRLQEQQEALAERLSTSLRQEREMRGQEHTQLTERVEQRVRQLLPREVESACVRFHALRGQRLATSVPGGAANALTSPGDSRGGVTHTNGSCSGAAAPSAEELRLSIVQPAMEHMRRLLVSHQEMIDATVEDRCRRAERTVEGGRHVWSQNVAELRTKLSALRGDVRGAFSELCENLKVASPAL